MNRSFGILLLLLIAYSCLQIRLVLSNVLQLDEAYTYHLFVSQGFWKSWSFYPFPNNHILLSMISSLLVKLPGEPIFWMRMVALPFLWHGSMHLYATFNKLDLDLRLALLAVAVVLFNAAGWLYGWQARGYSLSIALALLSCSHALRLMKSPESRADWVGLAVWTALGMLTLPSQLYLSVGLYAALFVLLPKDMTVLKRWLLSGLAFGLLTLLLYTPVFAVSGIRSLTSNQFVEKRSLEEMLQLLPDFIRYIGNIFIGYRADVILYPLIAIALLLGLMESDRRKRGWLLLPVVLLLIPGPLLFIQKVIPFPRTFCWMVVPFALLLTGLLGSLAARFRFPDARLQSMLILLIGLAWFGLEARIFPQLAFSSGTEKTELGRMVYDSGAENIYVEDCSACLQYIFYTYESNGKFFRYTTNFDMAGNRLGDAIDDLSAYDALVSSREGLDCGEYGMTEVFAIKGKILCRP